MKKPKPELELRSVSIKLPEETVELMESLRKQIQLSPEYYGKVTVSTSAVMRMALIYGVEVIKQKYPA